MKCNENLTRKIYYLKNSPYKVHCCEVYTCVWQSLFVLFFIWPVGRVWSLKSSHIIHTYQSTQHPIMINHDIRVLHIVNVQSIEHTNSFTTTSHHTYSHTFPIYSHTNSLWTYHTKNTHSCKPITQTAWNWEGAARLHPHGKKKPVSAQKSLSWEKNYTDRKNYKVSRYTH